MACRHAVMSNGGQISYTGAATGGTSAASNASDAGHGSDGGANAGAKSQAGLERRVAWLEEDVAVLHRRLRDDCSELNGTPGGDTGLRSLVARLDGELAAERRARESLGTRMASLEREIAVERRDREDQLRGFSTELEDTMRTLIARIDDGLSSGAALMRERSDATEVRLRSLIQRVDQGLSAGAVALQDSLSNRAVSASPSAAAAGAQCGGGSQQRSTSPAMAPEGMPRSSDELIETWNQLRQENRQLKEQRAKYIGQPFGTTRSPGGGSQGCTPNATPSLAYPSTLQVPGSGIPANPTLAPGASGGLAGSPGAAAGVSGTPGSSGPRLSGIGGQRTPMGHPVR